MGVLSRHIVGEDMQSMSVPHGRDDDDLQFLDNILTLARHLMDAPGARVVVTTGFRSIVRHSGFAAGAFDDELAPFPAATGRQAPLIVHDTRADPHLASHKLVTGEPHLRSYVGVPLLTPAGRPLGTLSTLDKQPRRPRSREIEALRHLGAILMDELAMRQLACRDGLTGLLTRRFFLEEAARALALAARQERPLSCIMVDVDHFKHVNDLHGHAAGDAVLRRVTESCRGGLRTSDLLGRIGGEEFCAILPDADTAGAFAAAQRLSETIARSPLRIGQARIPVTVSTGISSMRQASSLPQLIAFADAALYESKRGGRNRCTMFGTRRAAMPVMA